MSAELIIINSMQEYRLLESDNLFIHFLNYSFDKSLSKLMSRVMQCSSLFTNVSCLIRICLVFSLVFLFNNYARHKTNINHCTYLTNDIDIQQIISHNILKRFFNSFVSTDPN